MIMIMAVIIIFPVILQSRLLKQYQLNFAFPLDQKLKTK